MSEELIPFLPIEDLQPVYCVSAFSETMDWGLVAAGIPEVHKRTRGTGIKIAVLDTGAPNHMDLNTNLLPPINCSRSATVFDGNGHQTHVSGIIAAVANGFGIIGVAPEAKILSIKVLDDSGHSGYEEIAAGIREAVNAGVDIINMSLGAPVEPPQCLYDAIKLAASKGIIIISAAGNDAGAVNWPARYDEVIAVAAIDKNGAMASFSSHGPKVAVEAPGVDIFSTYLNGQYALMCGTSQASPFVAGICALLLAWQRSNPSIPPINGVQDMLQRLDDLCDPSGRLGFQGKMGDIGFGIPSFINHMPWK